MKIISLILLLAGTPPIASGQPSVLPTYFLGTEEPVRMCNNYIHEVYGSKVTALTQPSGGALIRFIDSTDSSLEHRLNIFCDAPTHRLVIFSVLKRGAERVPYSVKCYGLLIPLEILTIECDSLGTFSLPDPGWSAIGCLDRPVDVAVSSCGRYYYPEKDNIFVLDQANRRVVKLRYDPQLDSLIWIESFGNDILKMPTALDYADYGDDDPSNDDIYIVDPGATRIFRFSASGVMEISYGYWGSGIASLGYPTGIAVSTCADLPKRFYVSDSHNYKIVCYYSDTNGGFIAESQHIFPRWPWPLISGIDTDSEGNVYVANAFSHTITILPPSLRGVLAVYGDRGYEPGEFDFPSDIYIDDNEMQVCELFADSSGIQTFVIAPDSLENAAER